MNSNKSDLNSIPSKQKNALIVFTRDPELGKCKTRLAKTIGDKSALNIYKYLLNHTAEITTDLNADKFVFYSENIKEKDMWDSRIFKKHLQLGTDLGHRMEHAFQTIFKLHYEKAIIIGSDLLDLKTDLIETAFQLLDHNDYVIGPATDGGYYLLGMKTMNSALFKEKNWPTYIKHCAFASVLAVLLQQQSGFGVMRWRSDVQ